MTEEKILIDEGMIELGAKKKSWVMELPTELQEPKSIFTLSGTMDDTSSLNSRVMSMESDITEVKQNQQGLMGFLSACTSDRPPIYEDR